MVFRKPYAFLIKNFKKIHILMLILWGFVYYKIYNLRSFVKEFVSFGTYNENLEGISTKVTASLFVAAIFLILISIALLFLLRHKKKPWKLYLVIIVEYILMIYDCASLLSFFNSYTNDNLISEVFIYRDILNIVNIIQYFVLIILLMRITGLDLKKFSFNIDNDALNLFINKLNDDLYVITSELDKMILYKDNKKTINLDDVRLVTSKIINSDIFDLIDAITKKNINEALALYDDLVLMQEEEIKLIVILANQFRLIYQVKEMYKMGYSELDIANSLDVHPYRVKLAKNIDISSNDAIKYLRKLANLDELIKTGKIDKKEGFYKFMLSI